MLSYWGAICDRHLALCSSDFASWNLDSMVVSGSLAVNFSEPGLWSARFCKHSDSDFEQPWEGRVDLRQAKDSLSYLDSSVKPEGQYLMTQWFNPYSSQKLK